MYFPSGVQRPSAVSGLFGSAIVRVDSDIVLIAGSVSFAIPKSRIFTRPAPVIMMLAGFRSRCTMPAECAQATHPALAELLEDFEMRHSLADHQIFVQYVADDLLTLAKGAVEMRASDAEQPSGAQSRHKIAKELYVVIAPGIGGFAAGTRRPSCGSQRRSESGRGRRAQPSGR